MFEQGGDREPVGKRAHHAGLSGGPDVAHPCRGAVGLGPGAEQEDHGGADQEAQRDDLHPPQPAAALGVGDGLRSR
jgi:hypothetical protein